MPKPADKPGLCYVRNLDVLAGSVDVAIVRDGEFLVARFSEADCYRLAEHILAAARAMRQVRELPPATEVIQ